MQNVQFRRGTKAQYDALLDKDENDFYIIGGNDEPVSMYVNNIPLDGSAQTFDIEASDNLQWSIDDRNVTPNIESGGFDDITKL